jgi:hypothetical protein
MEPEMFSWSQTPSQESTRDLQPPLPKGDSLYLFPAPDGGRNPFQDGSVLFAERAYYGKNLNEDNMSTYDLAEQYAL